MATEGASDLHLCGGQRPRWRIDGAMREITDIPPLGEETVLELLGDMMEDRNRREYEATKDTDFAIALPGVGGCLLRTWRASVRNPTPLSGSVSKPRYRG